MTDDHFLGQYHLLERIGRGGMAEVYRARERTSDREVAIKIIRTELTDDPTLSRRFLREVRVLSRLSHPHILSPIAWGEADGIFYLVMPWVRRSSLMRARAGQTGLEAMPPFHSLRPLLSDVSAPHPGMEKNSWEEQSREACSLSSRCS